MTTTLKKGARITGSDRSKLSGFVMTIEISPDRTRIGWIGTGVMGRSMCGHLLAAGYKVTLFTRTK